MPKKIIAAGYGRVSSMKQALEGTSAEDQKKRIQDYCAKEGWQLYEFYNDDGISGKTMEHRPGIQKLIRDAKAKKFNTLVFTKLDRIGRNNTDLHNFCHLMQEECGLDLLSIDVPAINSKGPFGKLMLAILGGFAEFEREIIRERTAVGRYLRWSQAKDSKAVIGALPFGYMWDKKQKEIVEHPVQGPIVRRIFSMYLDEGYSIKQIAIKLTEDAIPTPSAAKFTKAKNKIAQRWSNMAVGKILKHEAYTGRPLQLNKFKRATAVSKNSGRPYIFATKERRDKSEWLEARYPALIPEERWESAQKQRERQRIKPKKKHRGHEDHFLANGLIFCGECGGKIKPKIKNELNSNCKTVRYYYTCYWKGCSNHDLINSGRDRCSLTSVDAEHVDAILWGHIVRILSNPSKYAEQWFSDKDVGLLKAKIAKLEADEKIARDRACFRFQEPAQPQ